MHKKVFSTPQQYIDTLTEPRKSEILSIHNFICENFPHLTPGIMKDMIGYGPYHYKYASGREGDWYKVGLVSRSTGITIYICDTIGDKYIPELFHDRLTASVGKSCIRYKKFSDIDVEILREMIEKISQK